MGTLYLVSTPVGNLEDITLRAIRMLQEADLILAEDTRVTGKLLGHLEIKKPMKSYHDHNKTKVTSHFIELLLTGQNIALVTDAGTPAIADPAFYIVREAIQHNIPIVPIPGATAFVPALISSGLPSDRFIFENFLPSKASKRKRLFEEMQSEKRTVIFYESPHRIEKVLKEMHEVIPKAAVVVAREITKLHEEFLRGTPQSLSSHFAVKKPKGEIVVLFNNTLKDMSLFTTEEGQE